MGLTGATGPNGDTGDTGPAGPAGPPCPNQHILNLPGTADDGPYCVP